MSGFDDLFAANTDFAKREQDFSYAPH